MSRDNIVSITESELYVLAVIYGLEKLSGSFSQKNVRPDEKELPLILNSLSNKSLVLSDGNSLTVAEKVKTLLECYKKPHSVVFFRFEELYLPDMFFICCADGVLCAERLLYQSRGMKMFMTNPDDLYCYLLDEGFIESIPSDAMSRTIVDESEYAGEGKVILRIERHGSSGATDVWEVFYTSYGSYFRIPDGSVTYASRDAFAESLREILKKDGV